MHSRFILARLTDGQVWMTEPHKDSSMPSLNITIPEEICLYFRQKALPSKRTLFAEYFLYTSTPYVRALHQRLFPLYEHSFSEYSFYTSTPDV